MLKGIAKRFGGPVLVLSAGLALLQPLTAAPADWHGRAGYRDRGDRDRSWHRDESWRDRKHWEGREWRPGVGSYLGYAASPSYVAPAYPYSAAPNCAPQYNYPTNPAPSYGYPY